MQDKIDIMITVSSDTYDYLQDTSDTLGLTISDLIEHLLIEFPQDDPSKAFLLILDKFYLLIRNQTLENFKCTNEKLAAFFMKLLIDQDGQEIAIQKILRRIALDDEDIFFVS